MINASSGGSQYNYMQSIPVPAAWFTELARYSDTAYYRDVLKECGNFSRWTNGG